MRYIQLLSVLASAIVLGALASSAQAVSLPVLNPSFEADVLPLDLDYTLTAANWTGASQREGAINETDGSFPGALDAGTAMGADGTNLAFISGNSTGNNGKMSQVIAGSVQLGRTYTLTVAIGFRFGRQALEDWSIGLYEPAFASQFTKLEGVDFDLIQGEFLDFSTSFTADAGDVGKQLMVYFDAMNVPAGNGVTYFDNIRLTDDFVGSDADFDAGGDINGADFLIWQRGFGTGTTLAEGDADGSGTVDALDLVVWEDQYGTTPALSSVSVVPEPTSLVLVSLGGMLMLSISRKANR